MKTLAIIPARGGSKRIPRKNIKIFAGHPIISYAIKNALNSKCFDEVMVSTDDDEIAQVAIKSGASVPFKRSVKASDDMATTVDVLLEVLNEYNKIGKVFDLVCCIYPSTPLLNLNRISEGFKIISSQKELFGVATVLRYSYPIQRALEINNNKVRMLDVSNINTRSQDLPERYHDAGQFYWFRPEKLIEVGSLLGAGVAPIILSDLEAQDIDTMEDWRLAEFKYAFINTNESSQ